MAVTGHYGSGKTNFVANLAFAMAREGKKVTVVDLDVVNPYFRTTDFKEAFARAGIDIISPTYANSNLDIPALGAQVQSVFCDDEGYALFDVGGDDAGAAAMGRYSALFKEGGYEHLSVFNCYRYLTRSPGESLEIIREIETASRLPVTGLVNASNLGFETGEETILDSLPYAGELAAQTGLPVRCTLVREELYPALKGRLPAAFPVRILVRQPWQEELPR
ncbi:ParA family protein [Bittarella massiliensis (ex Durand et al. 2017)]|uniref:nucleotide-binding protein n=1 Tax=Bittarella massiliensis (ex Durand et al. 2017) TaxID=1720313 RepID=UPI00349FD32D